MTVEAVDKNAEPGKDPVIVKSSPQQTLIPTIEESRASEWPYEGFAREFIGKKKAIPSRLSINILKITRARILLARQSYSTLTCSLLKRLNYPSSTKNS